MHTYYLVPEWFSGFDVAFEMVFAIITLLVSFKAYRIYKMSAQRQVKLFSLSFLMISICYFAQAALNFIILERIDEKIVSATDMITLVGINNVGAYIHMILFMLALITLAYMTLDIKSPKTYVLLCVISFISIVLAPNKLLLVYVVSLVMLFYILIHYLGNYLKIRRTQTLIVLIAFALLFVASIHSLLSLSRNLDYAIAHLLTLIAYILILVNLIMVGNHEQKKRPIANHT